MRCPNGAANCAQDLTDSLTDELGSGNKNNGAQNRPTKCSDDKSCLDGAVCHDGFCVCVSGACATDMNGVPTNELGTSNQVDLPRNYATDVNFCDEESCYTADGIQPESGSQLIPAIPLARLAKAVYDISTPVIGYELLASNSEGKLPKDWLDFGLYQIVTSKEYFLVFRGTKPVTNWIFNFAILKEDCPNPDICGGGSGHAGFLQAYKNLSPVIQDVLEKHKVESVSIAGHSLGGALATIAAIQLEGIKINTFATFGAPAVGDREFAGAIEGALSNIRSKFRFVNQNGEHQDLIPNLLKQDSQFFHAPKDPDYLTCVRTDGTPCDDYKNTWYGGTWIGYGFIHNDLHKMPHYEASLLKAAGFDPTAPFPDIPTSGAASKNSRP